MKFLSKKITSLLLCFVLIIAYVLPVFADNLAITGDSDNASQTGQTNVKARVPSTFTIGIPKTVIINTETDMASYTISCTGDISGYEYVSVVPDTSFLLSQVGKTSVTATTAQSTTKFRNNDYTNELSGDEALMSTGISGEIMVNDVLTAGNWSGVLNFDIALYSGDLSVDATITDNLGNPIANTVSVITGAEKEILISKLLTSNTIQASDDVKALVEVQTDVFEGTATAAFDVSEFAMPGDTIFIYHYDSENDIWELISEEVVDDNCMITGNFTSFSPVAFTVEHINSSSITEPTSAKSLAAGNKFGKYTLGIASWKGTNYPKPNLSSYDEMLIDTYTTFEANGTDSVAVFLAKNAELTYTNGYGWNRVGWNDCVDASTYITINNEIISVSEPTLIEYNSEREDDFTYDIEPTEYSNYIVVINSMKKGYSDLAEAGVLTEVNNGVIEELAYASYSDYQSNHVYLVKDVKLSTSLTLSFSKTSTAYIIGVNIE